jgi:hypothetical protein
MSMSMPPSASLLLVTNEPQRAAVARARSACDIPVARLPVPAYLNERDVNARFVTLSTVRG